MATPRPRCRAASGCRTRFASRGAGAGQRSLSGLPIDALVATSSSRHHGATASLVDAPTPACTDPSPFNATADAADIDNSDFYWVVAISNTGSSCSLTGYPTVVELDSHGRANPVIRTVDDPAGSVGPVTLEPAPAVESFYIDFQKCATWRDATYAATPDANSFTGPPKPSGAMP